MTVVSHDTELQRRPEAEVEVEAGTMDYHELESDAASHQGCYSPVSSISDMEPSADHGRWPTFHCRFDNMSSTARALRVCYVTIGSTRKYGVRRDNRLLFDRELQFQLNINTLQQMPAIKYFFAQVDEILPKINALIQDYVRKQELVYFRV